VAQDHELTIGVTPELLELEALPSLVERFRSEYQRLYGYTPPDARIRIVNCRVTAGWQSELDGQGAGPAAGAAIDAAVGRREREVFFHERGGFVSTPIYDRMSLREADTVSGPAVVEQVDSTTILPPGWRLVVDRFRNLLLERI
jgi:N-methylhydantoinase A